jgi:hypothetical protein
VRSIMSSLMLGGSGLLPVTRSIMAAISQSPSRLMVSAVTCERRAAHNLPLLKRALIWHRASSRAKDVCRRFTPKSG